MLNHLILFEQFGLTEAKRGNFYKKMEDIVPKNPEFDEGESFKVGDMVYVDPNVCGRIYNFDPSIQYEIVEIEGKFAFLFDNDNEYIPLPTARLNVAYDKVPEDKVRWFEDGKLEE